MAATLFPYNLKMYIMANQVSKAECIMALSLIKTLYIETQPNEGHSSPHGVEYRWNQLEELVTAMAEQLEPGSSKDIPALFADDNGLIDTFPF